MQISLIVAIDSRGGISKNGKVPWHIKEDLNFFQDVTKRPLLTDQGLQTKKNVIIMGKKTWKEIPEKFRGLKDRVNIVISSTMTVKELYEDNKTETECYLLTSLDDALEFSRESDFGHVFIGGGKQIYEEAIKKFNIEDLYVTRIDSDYQCDNNIDDALSDAMDNYRFHDSWSFKVRDHTSDKSVDVTFIKLSNTATDLGRRNPDERQYQNLLQGILNHGDYRETRNGMVYHTFGKQLEFDLDRGFPILTTKKINFQAIVEELLWFLRGNTNAKNLSSKGVKIWDQNTSRSFLDSMGLQRYEEGDIGPMYGFQLLHFNASYQGCNQDYTGKGFNQIEYCLQLLKTDPHSRRIMMTTYNPMQAKEGCLFPCHGISIIFNVTSGTEKIPAEEIENIGKLEEDSREVRKLSCMMTQRSVDSICGLQFNLTSYALLMRLMCEVINNDPEYLGPKFKPGRLIMNLADTHIYEQHYEQAIRQILRPAHPFPKLEIKTGIRKLEDFKFEDFQLIGYEYEPYIPVKMVA